MAKTTAGLFALGASGSIGDALTFASWRGRQYARLKVKPSNPKSAAQKGVRSMFKFLSQAWAAILTASQATWDAPADSANFLPFNAYQQQNSKRWAQAKAPTQVYPATEDGTLPSMVSENLTGGVGELTLDLTTITPDDGWGIMVFLETTTGFTPSRNNCVAVIPFNSTNDLTLAITGLAADDYFVVTKYFTTTGKLGSANAELTAAVT